MANVAVKASSDLTKWNQFVNSAKNQYNQIRGQTMISAGLPYNATPVRDSINNLVSQWIKPAASDALSVVGNIIDNSVNRITGVSASDALSAVGDMLASGSSSSGSPSYSSVRSVVNSGAAAAPSFDYLYADLAKHYGMDEEAAYSEALQNTAYQRAVADLKAAGLNPVLAAGKVSPAGSFAAGNTLSGGSGSGSSGGYRGYGSGKYALSSDAYNLLGVAGTLVGGLVGYKMTSNPAYKLLGASTGMAIGKNALQSGAQGISSIKNLFK